jgi:quercetin dioxygenase-like cupin family protein
VNYSRRDLALLLPVLAAAGASGQQPNSKKGPSGPPEVLRSKAYDYKDMHVTGTGPRPAANIFSGITTRGQELSIHLSNLAPGLSPHPPHQHLNEELLVILDGTIDVELEGKVGEFGHGQVTRLGPGSVAFMASNIPHGWKNVGATTAKYYVLAIADHK